MSEILGSNIRRLKKEARITYGDLGEICHVIPKTVSSWVNTKSDPNDLQTLVKLADFFTKKLQRLVTVDELLDRDLEAAKQLIS